VIFIKITYRHIKDNPGVSISKAQIQQCICPCIAEEKITECACPICTDLACEVRALRENIKNSNHHCVSCDPWILAFASTESLVRCLSCADEKLDSMNRLNSTEDFHMRPLRCCVSDEDIDDLKPCCTCTFERKLPKGKCATFSENNLNKEVIWLKRQPTIEGKEHNRVVDRLRSYKGTLRELLDSVERKTKPFMYHLWKCRFIRRCFHLDCDFFDAQTEIVILADFASAMVI
jgi:hypothetical protein